MSFLLPSATGHPFGDALGIGIMVGMAMGYDERTRVADVVMDSMHLDEGAWTWIYVEHLSVMLYEHTSGGAHLIHRGVSSTASAQEGQTERHEYHMRLQHYDDDDGSEEERWFSPNRHSRKSG